MGSRLIRRPSAAKRFVSRSLVLLLLLGSYVGAPRTARAANVTVNVDYNSPRQTLEGFGASATWVANDIDKFSAAKQTQILDLLYKTGQPGAALSWVRVGSFLCDFSPSPGVYDWNHWGIQSEMRWLQRVNASYGVNRYMVSTWSPPAWMKDNNSCTNGGHVLPQYYADLAALKVQWLQNARAQLGFEAQVESVQNEPNMRTTYDSCEWTTSEISSFVANNLQPALAASGLTARIMAPEPAYYSNFDASWGSPILSNAAARAAIQIVATHGYGRTDDFSKPCASCATYNKPIWQTEDSNLDGRYNGSIDDGMTWAAEISKALGGGRFSAWFYWWVMDLNGGNEGLIHADPSTDSFQVPKRLYVLGHFSRFMRPGSVVLGSTSGDSTLLVTAVRPTSGNVAVVLANTGRNSHTVTVNLNGLTSPPASVTPHRTSATENQAPLAPVGVTSGSFTITVPSKTVVTVVG
ncbi:MAG TPA: glycoside hydrolase family 30 beta sandwich domain-containing protein [Pyrinomonadaceae bacterium]|nr:glycoside hydrolase family 30 beta sandwich domain-containing protein [Pyrinomonadaceae bacterium]